MSRGWRKPPRKRYTLTQFLCLLLLPDLLSFLPHQINWISFVILACSVRDFIKDDNRFHMIEEEEEEERILPPMVHCWFVIVICCCIVQRCWNLFWMIYGSTSHLSDFSCPWSLLFPSPPTTNQSQESKKKQKEQSKRKWQTETGITYTNE